MCDKNERAQAGYSARAGQQTLSDGATYIPELRILENAKIEQTRSMQYTPLLVMMMLEMYALPDRRAYYLYSNVIDSAQREAIELLKRAKIIVPAISPPIVGAAPMWNVDEEALRVYVKAVCSVPLPMFHWVMP